MCKFEVDTGSDDSLMPINMLTTLFRPTGINNLNKSINIKYCCISTINHANHKWSFAKLE